MDGVQRQVPLRASSQRQRARQAARRAGETWDAGHQHYYVPAAAVQGLKGLLRTLSLSIAASAPPTASGHAFCALLCDEATSAVCPSSTEVPTDSQMLIVPAERGKPVSHCL
eukprot:COSAG01_NODE_31238_length_601_cov_0.926295_1_plen_112_part_00